MKNKRFDQTTGKKMNVVKQVKGTSYTFIIVRS